MLCVISRPRGFGFIEFKDNRDAEDALYHLDRSQFMGREISVRSICRTGHAMQPPAILQQSKLLICKLLIFIHLCW
jgi:hypothetical protein